MALQPKISEAKLPLFNSSSTPKIKPSEPSALGLRPLPPGANLRSSHLVASSLAARFGQGIKSPEILADLKIALNAKWVSQTNNAPMSLHALADDLDRLFTQLRSGARSNEKNPRSPELRNLLLEAETTMIEFLSLAKNPGLESSHFFKQLELLPKMMTEMPIGSVQSHVEILKLAIEAKNLNLSTSLRSGQELIIAAFQRKYPGNQYRQKLAELLACQ